MDQTQQMIDSITKDKSLEEQYKVIADKIQHYNNKELTTRLRLSKALLDVAEQFESPKALGRAYYELGYSYEIIGENDLAIDACLKALKHLEKAQDTIFIAFTYNEIGLIYSVGARKWKLYKAIEYFNKFLEMQEILGDTGEIAGAISNIGFAYLSMQNYDSALYFNRKALKLRLSINQERTIPISYGNVGISLFHQGKTDSALYLYKKAYRIYEKQKNYWGKFEVITSILQVYHHLKDYDKVLYYLKEQETLAQDIQSKTIDRHLTYQWYKYYKAIRDYDMALNYHETYFELTDSIRGERVDNKIATLQAVYEVDKMEDEMQLLKQAQEIRKQRNQFTIVVMVLGMAGLVLLIAILVVKRRKDALILEQKEQLFEKEKALTQSELENAKIQQQELNTQLEYKSKQLTSHALHMMQKNQFLQDLEKEVGAVMKKSSTEVKGLLRSLNLSIKRQNKQRTIGNYSKITLKK